MTDQKTSAEQRFGQMVKALRAHAGMSQREVAERMVALEHGSWLQSTVAKTEAAERPLRLNEYVSLCLVLDQDPAEALRPLVTGSMDRELRAAELRLALERARRNAQRAADESKLSDDLVLEAQQELDAFLASGEPR